MLSCGNSGLFTFPLMPGKQFFRAECLYFFIGQAVAKTPVILSSHKALTTPLIITPPHGTKGKKILYLPGIIQVEFLGVIRIFVQRMVRVCSCTGIEIGIGVFNTSPVGIKIRFAIIEQKRFFIPVKPQIFVFFRFVDFLVKVLNHSYNGSVKCPETEFRHPVSIGFHLLHYLIGDFPLSPVTNRIGYIENDDIHTRIGKHGHVFSDHIFVLTEKITHFRFPPVIRVLCPQGMKSIKPRFRCFAQYPGHICSIGWW